MAEIKDNLLSASLMSLSAIAITAALYFMKPVLVPFVFSIFLFFAINPMLDFMNKKLKFPRSLGLFITLLFLLGCFCGVILLLAISVSDFVQSSADYQAKLIDFANHSAEFLQGYGIPVDMAVINSYIQGLPFANWIKSFSSSAVGMIGNLVLILVFTFFLVMGKTNPKMIESPFNQSVQKYITWYIIVKFITSAATGILVWLSLVILGVQLSLLFGILTFLLNFIPNIGSVIAVLLPIPVAFLQFGFGWIFILSILLPFLVQFVIGSIIEPGMQGKQLGLHPVAVLLALLFWGFIWGVSGMFLSIPITCIMKLLMEKSPRTKVFAKLLEGNIF